MAIPAIEIPVDEAGDEAEKWRAAFAARELRAADTRIKYRRLVAGMDTSLTKRQAREDVRQERKEYNELKAALHEWVAATRR